MKIFYCWQSNRPEDRNFIERSLEVGVRAIRADDQIAIEPVVDRDTRGLPGSPEISQSIFAKIRESAAVVADVTIVGMVDERPFCNPNVLVEVGYALASIGDSRVILVMNTSHGEQSALPFDLRSRRALGYHLTAESDRQAVRRQLAGQLEHAIRLIADSIQHTETPAALRTIEIAINESMESIDWWLANANQQREFIGLTKPQLASQVLDLAVQQAATISEELYRCLSSVARALRQVDEYLAAPRDNVSWLWVTWGNAIRAAQGATVTLAEASRILSVLKSGA